ncbi:acyltransferase family protein [Rhodocytophaga rosea]|uniref:Acyltransferase family protein n=1 Tax=Rhodocytophaga rosea TaxID=2704465 RepID=A0A6C0GKU5_9BACT|nr:acyltransferase family protein [Rhodocytophaga rosea]QHT68599.1 acyltransferase family protein [Rhodocytophaga rosea]
MNVSTSQIPLKKERLHELDWLRVMAFSLLVFYHGSFIFSGGFYVSNSANIPFLSTLMTFISQWRLPLLFFISGASVAFLYKKSSTGEFVNSRLTRILVPLVFGVLIINPPQSYIAKGFKEGSFPYYPSYYAESLANIHFGSGEALKWNHLWYLVYIFVFSIILIPMFHFFKKNPEILQKIGDFFTRRGMLLLLILPPFISGILLQLDWPTKRNLISDWDNFTTTILFFIYGYLLYSHSGIRAMIMKYRTVFLILGICCFIAMALLFKPGQATAFIQIGEVSPAFIGYKFLRVLNTGCWLLCILGFAQKYLRFRNNFLNYTSEAVYPFYILHQTVMVFIAYFVVQWQMMPLLKYIVIMALTFMNTLLIYEFLIKRTAVTRLLFGLRTKVAEKDKMIISPQTQKVA